MRLLDIAIATGVGFGIYYFIKKNKDADRKRQAMLKVGEKATNDAYLFHERLYYQIGGIWFRNGLFDVNDEEILSIARRVENWSNVVTAYNDLFDENLMEDLSELMRKENFRQLLDIIEYAKYKVSIVGKKASSIYYSPELVGLTFNNFAANQVITITNGRKIQLGTNSKGIEYVTVIINVMPFVGYVRKSDVIIK